VFLENITGHQKVMALCWSPSATFSLEPDSGSLDVE
jgi:hypothetical protein